MGVIMTIGAHWKIRLPASHAPGVFYEITKIHLECRNPPCLVDMKYTLIGIATTIPPVTQWHLLWKGTINIPEQLMAPIFLVTTTTSP